MTKIHNILIVPDKFKGSLSAADVADALEAAVRRCMVGGRQAKVVKLPMADGGDGSMEVVEAAMDSACERVMIDTFDALMRPMKAPLLLFDRGRQAFIEMAKVCGLAMLAPEERNPEKTTTYGLGVLLAEAIRRGCEKIVVGIGGSATNDGGEGLLIALSDILDDSAFRHPRPDWGSEIVVACDVDNPLLGTNGATMIYGPQKGVVPEIRDERLAEAEPPYILLANHESFFDFYYIHQMAHPRNPTFLVNEFYTTRPVLKTLSRRAGILSKKLFTTELSSPIRIMRMLKNGHSVVIFPEGRLSPDGRSNPIVEEGGAFYKRMNVDLVLVKINGAYFADPKWRKKRFRTSVSVSVEDVIKKDRLRAMPEEELNAEISELLYNDASEHVICRYPQRNKAAGLEGILYRCADCGALYSAKGRGNRLVCEKCGSIHTLDEHYRFTEPPCTIGAWYDLIREAEEKELDTLSLHAAVRTLIHGKDGGKNRKEKGECFLTPDAFTYRSQNIEFSIPTEKLPALAFSCGEEFELYHEGELYYFYPVEQPQQVARWALAVDLMSERRRGEKKKKETM